MLPLSQHPWNRKLGGSHCEGIVWTDWLTANDKLGKWLNPISPVLLSGWLLPVWLHPATFTYFVCLHSFIWFLHTFTSLSRIIKPKKDHYSQEHSKWDSLENKRGENNTNGNKCTNEKKRKKKEINQLKREQYEDNVPLLPQFEFKQVPFLSSNYQCFSNLFWNILKQSRSKSLLFWVYIFVTVGSSMYIEKNIYIFFTH